jgi:hypothetical protein
MKTQIIFFILSITFLSHITGQKNPDYKGTLPGEEKVLWIDSKTGMKGYWLDSQLYQFAKVYHLEDSMFVNSTTIKSGYTLLRYYPKIEVDRYFAQRVKSDARQKDWNLYLQEAKEFREKVQDVKNSNEYLDLLSKYPRYKVELIKVNDRQPDYRDLENKIKSGEIRIAKMNDSEEVIFVHKKFENDQGRHTTLPIR